MGNWMRPAGAVAAALVVAGCGGEKRLEGTEATPSAEATAPRTPESKVKFVAPADGSTVGSTFTAKVELENFVIDVEAVGKSPQPGRGHLHFRLDEGRFDVPGHAGENGELAEQLGVDGKYSPGGAPEITYSDIPPGEHVLEVYLANNNHTQTGVEAETTFRVR